MNNNINSSNDEKKSENNSCQNNIQPDNNTNNIINENKIEIEALKAEIAKLRQSKIIESSELKLELTKYKVKLKAMTNEIEKLKQEKIKRNNKKEENMEIMKINEGVNNISKNTDEIYELKNKNKLYQEQIIKMQKEMEEYKANAGAGVGNGVDAKKLERLEKENSLYLNKIQDAQERIAKANSIIDKVKKYNLCMSYIITLLGNFKPSDDKMTYLFNKLKILADEFEKGKNRKKYE